MPALPGGVITTIPDVAGQPLFVVYEWYVPTPSADGTNPLRDAATTTSRGTRTGALIVDNMTGRSQQVLVTNPETGASRTFNISPNGAALTVAQLAAQTPPVKTIQDLAGLSPFIS